MELFQLEKHINLSATPAGENKIIMFFDKLHIFLIYIPFVRHFPPEVETTMSHINGFL